MRRTIAPTLWRFVDDPDCRPSAKIGAARELRALLAVARAARMHSHAEVPYDPIDESRFCSICRALARLDRSSRPQRAGRGRG